jgi:hypothetical protein
MLRFLISFRLVGENDFLYPTSFKRYFRHLDNTPSGEEDRFIHQGDLVDDSVDDPTHPLLGTMPGALYHACMHARIAALLRRTDHRNMMRLLPRD